MKLRIFSDCKTLGETKELLRHVLRTLETLPADFKSIDSRTTTTSIFIEAENIKRETPEKCRPEK